MAALRPPLTSSRYTNPPPLPVHGPAEVSEEAQLNFAHRQRLFWLKRLLPIYWFDTKVTPIENHRREIVKGPLRKFWKGKWHVEPLRRPWRRRDVSSSQTSNQDETDIVVSIEDSDIDTTREEHIFQWAVVLEHQRGNVPFLPFLPRKYTSNFLALDDPPAYIIVTPEFPWTYDGPVGGDDFPDFKLDDYPLPDGNWRWVSKEWMVDMRDGNVQYDGFEYNWGFKMRGWRSKSGRLGVGAWVRRRRWVRLMERPPLSMIKEDIVTPDPVRITSDSAPKATDLHIWRGDDGDWTRIHDTMHRLGRDGRKLEAWRKWIGSNSLMLGSRFRHRQWSDDEDYLPSEIVRDNAAAEDLELISTERPDPNYIAQILRSHGDDILRLFIYPGSRLDFIQLVKAAGFAPDLLSAPILAPVPFVEAAEIHKLSAATTSTSSSYDTT